MNRLRTMLATCVVLAALAVMEPSRLRFPLDTLRYAVAEVCVWPWVLLTPRTRHAEATADPELDPLALWAAHERRLAGMETGGVAVRVIRDHEHSGFLIVDRGHRAGLAPGCAVSVRGVLVGFVDRCEAHLSRVRRLAHRDSYFSGAILLEDALTGHAELATQVLLRGDGAGLAVPERGSVIDGSLIGRRVYTLAQDGLPADLLIGQVVADSMASACVRLPDQWRTADVMSVHGRDGRSQAAVDDPAFSAIEARIVALGDGILGADSIMLDVGARDGVSGDGWVQFGDRVIAKIARVGLGASRAIPIGARGMGLEAVALIPGTAEGPMSAFTTCWPDAALKRDHGGAIFARGRSDGAPRGALLANRTMASEAEVAPAREPRLGDSVGVLIFSWPGELSRLLRGVM